MDGCGRIATLDLFLLYGSGEWLVICVAQSDVLS